MGIFYFEDKSLLLFYDQMLLIINLEVIFVTSGNVCRTFIELVLYILDISKRLTCNCFYSGGHWFRIDDCIFQHRPHVRTDTPPLPLVSRDKTTDEVHHF